MLNRAVKWKQIHANAIRDAELFKLDNEPSDPVLSSEEEVKLLAACEESELRYRGPHLSAIILVALCTGLRRGEILKLRRADINFQKNVFKDQDRQGPQCEPCWDQTHHFSSGSPYVLQ